MAINGKFNTSLMPAQKAFMESLDSELLYSGAFGAGKSRVGCEKGMFLSLLYPGNVGVIIRKTFTSLRITTMQTWERDVCPPEYGIMNKQNHEYTFTNGSKVYFIGLDDPQKIGSLEVGWIFIDEAIELDEEDYTMLLGRLRLNNVPFRQIFCATNPASNVHWLYLHAYVNKQMRVFESDALKNIYTPADYKARLEKFKGIYRDRYVLGKWVGAEGTVYDCFDYNKHVIEPFTIPANWIRYRAIDFGYTNPFVCLWFAQAPHDSKYKGYYVYREIYMSQRTAEQHAKHIVQLTGKEIIRCTFADWAAGDRATIEMHGVPNMKAVKDISAGIQSVYNLLANDMIHFFNSCLVEIDPVLQSETDVKHPKSTVEEFGAYKYPSANKALGNIKEEPIDKNNHGMDAIRYGVHSLAINSIGSDLPVIFATKTSKFTSDGMEELASKDSRWKEEGIFEGSSMGSSRWN